jgi:tRNA threonylcarbamoyladenosine biosynthesis protein TsaE
MTTSIHNLSDLNAFARDFLQNLPEQNGATLVTFSGDLGAGKTTLTQMIAKELGVTETVTSPTFVIMKEYALTTPDPSLERRGDVVSPPAKGEIKRGFFTKLIHIDAYRLESGQELLALGFAEELTKKENLIIMEWPEQVSDIELPVTKAVTLSIGEGEVREIEVV